jgi:hypothetical protein
MKKVMRRCAAMMRDWKASKLETWAEVLERKSSEPTRITWDPG